MTLLRCVGYLLPYTEVAPEAEKSTLQSPHLMLERSAGCIGYANHFDEHTEPAISTFSSALNRFRESMSQNDDLCARPRFPLKTLITNRLIC
jgi:hypothetical protein